MKRERERERERERKREAMKQREIERFSLSGYIHEPYRCKLFLQYTG